MKINVTNNGIFYKHKKESKYIVNYKTTKEY